VLLVILATIEPSTAWVGRGLVVLELSFVPFAEADLAACFFLAAQSFDALAAMTADDALV